MKLAFDPRVLPRSISRSQWRDLDRWRRLTQMAINQNLPDLQEEFMARMNNVMIYGTSYPEGLDQ